MKNAHMHALVKENFLCKSSVDTNKIQFQVMIKNSEKKKETIHMTVKGSYNLHRLMKKWDAMLYINQHQKVTGN